MNFLKKKLKPLTSSLSSYSSHSHASNKHQNDDEDLENDLYDDQVIDVPPHPSELLALGVDPTDIDVNDPEKLRELYRKAKEEGKDKKTNSVLLAKQRQKEEIEEKKKTGEEWKLFDSITARVELAVKETKKTLEQLEKSSAVETIAEPEYELRLTPDQVFKPATSVKQERTADNWINFSESEQSGKGTIIKIDSPQTDLERITEEPRVASANQNLLDELLDDFSASPSPISSKEHTARENQTESEIEKKVESDDPFDTSFVFHTINKPTEIQVSDDQSSAYKSGHEQAVDPFDTSYVDI